MKDDAAASTWEGMLEIVCNLWNRRWTTMLLGRIVVLLTGLLLFMMPITEYACDWDHFLRGGPDVEFSLLAWLLFAAFILLTMNGTILRPRWFEAGIGMRSGRSRRSAQPCAVPLVFSGVGLRAGRERDLECLKFPPLRI